MSDQSAMIESMKVACLKVTTTLCAELFRRLLDAEIMSVLGIVYPQYWLCDKNATRDFLPHLDKIKVAFCVGKKIKGGVVIVGLLDSRQLDVQVSYFRLTMSHNVEAMMQKPSNVNMVIQMWLENQSSPLLVLKLNEYINIVEIVMVQVLGSIEDERTFSNLTFMKSKLCNKLTAHIDLCVCMFTYNFYNVSNFPYDAAIVAWKEVCIRYHIDY